MTSAGNRESGELKESEKEQFALRRETEGDDAEPDSSRILG